MTTPSTANMITTTAAEADRIGFGRFNDGEHICIEVPDGHTTISVRTSAGRRITFAFVPYSPDGVPQCVDILDHDGAQVSVDGEDRPHQKIIAFRGGRTSFRPRGTGENDVVTLTTVLIN